MAKPQAGRKPAKRIADALPGYAATRFNFRRR
jgi:hypothetical protein